ncbi:MAG: ankyrin repeat domain-containing protein [Alphaproteobacteria bacterium]|nr:ankyrin repeat domain-containing protein [Alphaproteobacteria bacterium]
MNAEELNTLIGQTMIKFILDDKMPEDIKLIRLEFYLDKDADVNTQMYGKSLLTHAKEKLKNKKFEERLVAKGAKEWVISEETALELGRQFWDNDGYLKSVEEIKELVIKGADVNAKEEDGWTALMSASRFGRKEIAELLIENGADVNAKDKYDWTALMHASYKGNKKVVELLIENGADVNAKSKYSWTALMFASENGHKEIAERLIAKGTDVNVKDKDGKTALMWASENGHKDIAELLEKAEEESKSKLKEDMKEDSKSLRGSKDEKNNTKGGFWNRMFGGNDGM